MTAPPRSPERPLLPAPPPNPPRGRRPEPRRGRWVASPAAGVAVLLAGTPAVAVLQGTTWLADAAAAAAVVVAAGLALQRLPGVAVAAGQLVALAGLLTALFTDTGVLAVLPGPGTAGAVGGLLAEAGAQIATGIAPVVPSPGLLFLVTLAFGLLTVAVDVLSVSLRAPAAAGVPMLCLVAVPTALTQNLLPWWTLVCAAVGFGLVLLAHGERGRPQLRALPGGVAVLAVATVVALLAGSAVTVVGTAGRFTGAASGSGGTIGLNPFTSLRGQLTRSEPTELFRVTGLPRPTYLRALTLRDYRADTGWQAGAPRPGVRLGGPLTPQAERGTAPARISVENVGFRDYWLPLYGAPDSVDSLDQDLWAYDTSSSTAYSTRPREEESWQQVATFPAPTADALRAARGPTAVDSDYLDVSQVDPRVAAIAAEVTRAAPTAFDKAIALVDWFSGPDTAFRYSLQTARGSGDDALVEFLTVGRAGYCEQFASAMAVMLRTQGVPARVAVGFTAGTEAAGYRSVSSRDAHAWVEAWFPGHGWVLFDPTPLDDGRTIVPPYVEQAQQQERGAQAAPAPEQQAPQQEVAPESPSNHAPPPVDTPAPERSSAGAPQPAGPGLGDIVGLLAVLVGVLLAGPAVLRALLRRRRLAAAAAGGPGAAAAAWAEILATARDRGTDVAESDTVRHAARRLVRERALDSRAQDALRQVIQLVEADFYGGAAPEAGALRGPVEAVLGALGPRRGVVSRLVPPSVVDLVRRRRVGTGSDAEPAAR